jgi:trk system potassium uptake protein TrkH
MVHAGCAGSTSGGLKVGRFLLLLKSGRSEIRRLIRPRAIFVVRYNGHAVNPDIIASVQAFFIAWVTIFILASIAVTATGMDILSAASAVVTTMSNVGPGLGSVGAVDNFGHLPAAAKWILSFCVTTQG